MSQTSCLVRAQVGAQSPSSCCHAVFPLLSPSNPSFPPPRPGHHQPPCPNGERGAHHRSEGWALHRCHYLSVAGGAAGAGCPRPELAAWGGTLQEGLSSPHSCSPGGSRGGWAGPGWWHRGSRYSGKPHWPPAPLQRWALRGEEGSQAPWGPGLLAPSSACPLTPVPTPLPENRTGPPELLELGLELRCRQPIPEGQEEVGSLSTQAPPSSGTAPTSPRL